MGMDSAKAPQQAFRAVLSAIIAFISRFCNACSTISSVQICENSKFLLTKRRKCFMITVQDHNECRGMGKAMSPSSTGCLYGYDEQASGAAVYSRFGSNISINARMDVAYRYEGALWESFSGAFCPRKTICIPCTRYGGQKELDFGRTTGGERL